MKKEKITDVAYCFNCKKYFDYDLTDRQGFICCPDCKGDYRFNRFNVIQLNYSKEEGYCFQIQDEMMIRFQDKNDFNNMINFMKKLWKLLRLRGD